VNDAWVPVPAADAYLRHLRLGADRAEGTTRVYAGDLCPVLGLVRDRWPGPSFRRATCTCSWGCSGRRRCSGSGPGGVPCGPWRINHCVREFYCHALASGGVDSSVLGLLYEVSDDRYLPAKLKT